PDRSDREANRHWRETARKAVPGGAWRRTGVVLPRDAPRIWPLADLRGRSCRRRSGGSRPPRRFRSLRTRISQEVRFPTVEAAARIEDARRRPAETRRLGPVTSAASADCGTRSIAPPMPSVANILAL